MLDPTLRFAARGWSRQECLEMLNCLVPLAAFDVQEGEAVVRTGKRGLEQECLTVRLDRFLEPIHARERDGEVLQRFGVVRLGAQGEPVRRDCSVEISGPLQRERLTHIVETLRLQLAFGPAAEEAAQPG